MTAPSLAEPAAPLIGYTAHPEGIHELTFRTTTRQAVDDWAVYQLWLDRITPPGVVIFELIDAKIGFPGMSYIIEKARKTIAEHSKQRKYVTVVLYPLNQRFYINLFASLINGLHLRNVQLRLLPVSQRSDAFAWLVSNQTKLLAQGTPSESAPPENVSVDQKAQ